MKVLGDRIEACCKNCATLRIFSQIINTGLVFALPRCMYKSYKNLCYKIFLKGGIGNVTSLIHFWKQIRNWVTQSVQNSVKVLAIFLSVAKNKKGGKGKSINKLIQTTWLGTGWTKLIITVGDLIKAWICSNTLLSTTWKYSIVTQLTIHKKQIPVSI